MINRFRARFPDRIPPVLSTVLRNVRKYLNSGTSLNLNKGNSGRRRTARSAENIDAVRHLLQANPHVTARRNPLPISRAGFNRITRLDIRWHPYQMHVQHELFAEDFPRRLRFAEWFNKRCLHANFLDSILIGDEAGLAMNGEVNTHNVRQYAPKGQPPAFNFQRNGSRAKLTVWAGLCGNGLIIGPYFFLEPSDSKATFQAKFAVEWSMVVLEVPILVCSYVYRVKGSGNGLCGAPVPKYTTVCIPSHLPNNQ